MIIACSIRSTICLSRLFSPAAKLLDDNAAQNRERETTTKMIDPLLFAVVILFVGVVLLSLVSAAANATAPCLCVVATIAYSVAVGGERLA